MKTALKETSSPAARSAAECRKAIDTPEAARRLFERQQREDEASATSSCIGMLRDAKVAAYFLEAERRFEIHGRHKSKEPEPGP